MTWFLKPDRDQPRETIPALQGQIPSRWQQAMTQGRQDWLENDDWGAASQYQGDLLNEMIDALGGRESIVNDLRPAIAAGTQGFGTGGPDVATGIRDVLFGLISERRAIDPGFAAGLARCAGAVDHHAVKLGRDGCRQVAPDGGLQALPGLFQRAAGNHHLRAAGLVGLEGPRRRLEASPVQLIGGSSSCCAARASRPASTGSTDSTARMEADQKSVQWWLLKKSFQAVAGFGRAARILITEQSNSIIAAASFLRLMAMAVMRACILMFSDGSGKSVERPGGAVGAFGCRV